MKKRITTIILIIVSLIILIVAFFWFFIGREAHGEDTDIIWDGTTISATFSGGNGTEENPYLISNGEDLAYFKQLIDGEEGEQYNKLYYALSENINLGSNEIEPIGIKHPFKGNFDGKGHTIKNITIKKKDKEEQEQVEEKEIVIEDYYYGLFGIIENANIKNFNIDGINILVDPNTNINLGLLAGTINNIRQDELDNNYIKNISIDNINVDLSDIEIKDEYNIGIISGTIKDKYDISNIYLQGKFISKDNIINEIFRSNESNIKNIVYSLENELDIQNKEDKISGLIKYDETTIVEKLLEELNKDIDEEFNWVRIDKYLIVMKKQEEKQVVNTLPLIQSLQGESGPIPVHASGTDSDTLYVNDLTADYNYYLGLNYTESSNGTSCTGANQNLYGTNNLVEVHLAYKGYSIHDENQEFVGYLSPSERISNFNYYKYYPIVNNQITIELIDNPYAMRPTDKAFNGWVTDYDGAYVTYDSDTYTRYLTVPVTSTASAISITLYASWTEATTTTASVSNRVLNVNNLKSVGMYPIVSTTPSWANNTGMPTVYIQDSVTSGNTQNGSVPYPDGAVNSNGQSLAGHMCSPQSFGWGFYFARTCTFYLPIAQEDIVENGTYYYLRNNNMSSYTLPTPAGVIYNGPVPVGTVVAGFYKKVTLSNNASLAGYYDQYGVLQTSGTCRGTCTYYELMQYDENNVIQQNDPADLYNYLVTRDTNIVYLTSNVGGFSNAKPLTITAINSNNVDHSNDYSIDLSNRNINPGADLRIEYVRLYSTYSTQNDSGPQSGNTQYIYGNFYNLKIGRGTKRSSSYYSAAGVVAGNTSTTGSSTSPTRYSMIVESGYYRSNSGIGIANSSSTAYNVKGKVIYGSDYDRINNANTNLRVYYTSASTWSGTVSSGSYTEPYMETIIKSGTHGENASEAASGFYAGGLNGGTVKSPAVLTVEGGRLMNINGGPLVDSSMENYNAIYINFKGGDANFIFGGAARSLSYGNRVVNVTGGTVRGGVFGGSNGYEGNDSSDTYRGIINGNTCVHVGGKATIGAGSSAEFEVDVGSVFGAGNGNTSSTKVGSVNNSVVVIGPTATINGNVYGGGNHGAVASQRNTSSTSIININGGTIAGSVYGGGNNNGAGTTDYRDDVTINVNGGTIQTSVFGGSRAKGVIYGNTTVNIQGGTINQDVYGGGEGGYTNSAPGTYVRDNVSVSVSNGRVKGSVYGGSAYGSVNTTVQNASTSSSTTQVTVSGGVVEKNVFGGGKGGSGYTPQVAGNITVNITGGSSGNVFGGFDASGSPKAGDIVNLTGGTIANGFGGGNNASQTTTDIRLNGTTITGNLYGGSNQSGTVTTSNVTVRSGTVTDIFGGNNLAGSTTTTHVDIYGGNIIGDVYGGGNKANSTTTYVTIHDGYLNDVFGGGYSAGVSNTTNINVIDGSIDNLFGGSNKQGTVNDTLITVSDTYDNRGNTKKVDASLSLTNNGEAWTDNTKKYISITPTIINLSDYNYTSWTATLTVKDSTLFDNRNYLSSSFTSDDGIYTITQTNINDANNPFIVPAHGQVTIPGYFDILVPIDEPYVVDYEVVATDTNNNQTRYKGTYYNEDRINDPNKGINRIYGGNNLGGTTDTSTITINNGTIGEIYGGGNRVGINSTDIKVKNGTINSVFGGSNISGQVSTSSVEIGTSNESPTIGEVYGGNNDGGRTLSTNVTITNGIIGNVYGGGNEAVTGSTNVVVNGGQLTNIYGGGNEAATESNTLVDIQNATITSNVFGGGNRGSVSGNSTVTFTDARVNGSLYAGGNEAAVLGNTSVTVDGESTIGTENTVTPNGSVFGSGNSASTGQPGNSKTATVNIVGGTIYGNVYGGANTSVVYGTANVNIGKEAVNINGLTESDISIKGVVFGGGESNAAGSPEYDWTAISVTEGINININGEEYEENNHVFEIKGSIFGSGNASSSSGDSIVYIKKLGTRSNPSENISIQRITYLTIDESVIHLKGAKDRTNKYDDDLYSFNLIGKSDEYGTITGGLTIKNNTILLLDENANQLVSFRSAVDDEDLQEEVLAEVTINDNTKTVTRNVDNRVYMLAKKKLNIALDPDANDKGPVKGMTFFGSYRNSRDNLSDCGIYNPNYTYDSNSSTTDIVVTSSYVLGQHMSNHDITKDGFYTNILDESTNYTKIVTQYINPTPNNTNFYRWIIGQDSIDYEFTITASKYQSMGTSTLQMIDFTNGDTTFSVLSFDESLLDPSLTLVRSTEVPKFARIGTNDENLFGLSMKSESTEWTSYRRTDFLSANSGSFDGDDTYLTNSEAEAPNLMFYLYYAKNIEKVGPLGKVVIEMQSSTPRNGYEADIKFVTITINIEAKSYADGNKYDASITYGKKYTMPVTTEVNITSKSQFTAYYSMISVEDKEILYGVNNENYHTLVSNYILPVGTTITMIDRSLDIPKYYYYEVNATNYAQKQSQYNQDHEVTYRLSDFLVMNTTTSTNKYNDAIANNTYYYDDYNTALEEFLFIFDFKDANIPDSVVGNEVLFEIRNAEDRTVVSVLDRIQEVKSMTFNIFNASNIVLSQVITNTNNNFHYDIANTTNYRTSISYSVNESNKKVVDTNYEESSMGVNIQLFTNNNDPVGANLLSGTKIRINNKDYLVDSDGIFRIKLAEKVTNITRDFNITVDQSLPVGEYTMVFTVIASSDGLHSSSTDNNTISLPIVVTGSDNAITVELDDKEKLFYKDKGKNENGTTSATFAVAYSSVLRNPNIRLSVAKRDVTNSTSRTYTDVSVNTLFDGSYTSSNNASKPYEVILNNTSTSNNLVYLINPNVPTGTYKITFRLYDGTVEVDSDETYIIVKKYIDDE